MLPILGKFTDLKEQKSPKKTFNNQYFKQNCQQIEANAHPLYVVEHLPTTTDKLIFTKFFVIFKNDSAFR